MIKTIGSDEFLRVKKFVLLAVALVGILACDRRERVPINLQHALALVDSIQVDRQKLYYITIYANYPDYKPAAAEGEGKTCVDDVGRFLEILQHLVLRSDRRDLLPIVRGMTRFLLYMSRSDGLWYNFMYSDGRINTTHVNSRAAFGWWAVRGLRGLAAAYVILKRVEPDSDLTVEVAQRLAVCFPHIEVALNKYPDQKKGFLGEVPAWLVQDAPDMNSELLLALTNLQETGDFALGQMLSRLAAGIIGYQICRDGHPLDGMYLCWQNTWHAWGSNQAYALGEVYRLTGEPNILKSLQRWADHFVPFLLKHDLPNEIVLQTDGSYTIKAYPQIAYGIHATYAGLKLLADITKQRMYAAYARQVFGWFLGNNLARTPLYDPSTGRVFDGIDTDAKVNRNSGAESTIEGLGAILKHQSFLVRQ